MRPRSRLALLALLLPAAVTAAAPAPAGAAREETLDNGLRVILIPHGANPMVASSVIVGAGVVHEPPGMNGASHFLEHLLFNGTETRTQRQLYDAVDSWGAYNNATTREDHTLFSLLVQKEFAEEGLALQADMLFRSTLPEENFEKEKGIVLEELARSRSDPAYTARERFRSIAYAGTPLEKPVLGTEASIGALGRKEVLAYYRSRYVPANMMLVLVGDLEPAAMMQTVRATFGAAGSGAPPAPVGGGWPVAPEKNLSRAPLEAGRAYLHAAFPLPLAPWSEEMAAAELLLAALASGDDAPLARRLREGAEPLALSHSLGVAVRAAPWSTVEFEAVLPEEGDPGAVLDRLAEGLRSLRPGGAARDRLGAVAARARADEILSADRIHYYVLTRSQYLAGSPAGWLVDGSATAAPGGAAIERAAALLEQGLAAIRVSVAGPGIAPETLAWKPAEAKPGGGPDAAGEAAQRLRSATLASGLQALVRRGDGSEVFAAHLLLHPRSGSEPAGKEGIAEFLHRLLLRGTIASDRAALAARMDAIGARVKVHDDAAIPYDDYYTTPEYSFIRLEMPSERWREGIALLAEIARHPRLAEEDVEAVRAEMLDLVGRRAESPRETAELLLDGLLAPGHPLARPVAGTTESIRSITAADLRSFHAGYVTGRKAILTIVGSADAGEMLEAVEAAFAGLAAGPETPAAAPPPPTRPGRSAEERLGRGQSSIAMAAVLEADPAEEAALTVAAALLSDRLAFRLREEKGLAYSIGAGVRPWGGRLRLDVAMGTRPDNVEEALAGLKEEIASFRRTEPDAAGVKRAGAGLRGRFLMRRLTRLGEAYFAGLDRMRDRPPGNDLERLAALLAVTPEAVRGAARKHFDPERMAVVVVR